MATQFKQALELLKKMPIRQLHTKWWNAIGACESKAELDQLEQEFRAASKSNRWPDVFVEDIAELFVNRAILLEKK